MVRHMTTHVFVAISPELLIALAVSFGLLVSLTLGSTISALVQSAQISQLVEKLKQNRIGKLYP